MLFLIELCLTAVAVLLAFAAPSFGVSWFAKWETRLSRLARRPRLAVAIVGALALILRAALLPFEPIPKAGVQDEFSYLLAADTFAHGRCTRTRSIASDQRVAASSRCSAHGTRAGHSGKQPPLRRAGFQFADYGGHGCVDFAKSSRLVGHHRQTRHHPSRSGSDSYGI